MREIKEALRLPSPAPRPQSLAFDGDKLWMGSVETNRIYAIDPRQWTIIEEETAPGKPWGMTILGDELRVVCGEGDDDDRFVRRFVPGHGFKMHAALRCPDGTGSQLSYDGTWLYLSQWYNRRLLALDEDGNVVRQIDLPHEVCGQCYVGGTFYLVTTEDEDSGEYFLTEVAGEDGHAWRDVARIPFAARALAYDGARFWTNHREANEIVAFER